MRIWIPGKFPNLNDYIKAERANRFAAAGMKKKWTTTVANEVALALAGFWIPQEMPTYPMTVKFIVHEENKRRDVDNVAATVSKFCLDGMVHGGLLPDDSQKYVNKIECDLIVDNEVGVEIII